MMLSDRVRRLAVPLIAFTIGLAVLATAAVLTLTPSREQGVAAVGGPFALVDHNGRTVTERDFAGNGADIYDRAALLGAHVRYHQLNHLDAAMLGANTPGVAAHQRQLADSQWRRHRSDRNVATSAIGTSGAFSTVFYWLRNDDNLKKHIGHRVAESYGPKKAQRMMGLKFRDNRVPTLAEFTEAAQREGMRAVKLTPA